MSMFASRKNLIRRLEEVRVVREEAYARIE
jgi:hypothetical protein